MKRTGPPATDLTEVDQAKKFSEASDVVVIGFFEDKESAEAKAFITTADSYDDLPFGITSVKEVAEALEAQMNTVVVFKKVIDSVVVYLLTGNMSPLSSGKLVFLNQCMPALYVSVYMQTALLHACHSQKGCFIIQKLSAALSILLLTYNC